MIVIWDSISGTPVKTIFNPHQNGVAALAISSDSMCLASLSQVDDVGEQEVRRSRKEGGACHVRVFVLRNCSTLF